MFSLAQHHKWSIADIENLVDLTFEGFKNVGDELKATVIVDGKQRG